MGLIVSNKAVNLNFWLKKILIERLITTKRRASLFWLWGLGHNHFKLVCGSTHAGKRTLLSKQSNNLQSSYVHIYVGLTKFMSRQSSTVSVELYIYKTWKSLPWECTCVRLPSIFEILIVWPSIFLAIKLFLNERAARCVIEWIANIINPTPLKKITSFCIWIILAFQMEA